MSYPTILALASVWATYFSRFAGAYLLLRIICRVIPSSQVRFRLWGIFVAGMAGTWLAMLSLPFLSALNSPATIAALAAPVPRLSLPVNPDSLSFFAVVSSRAPQAYALVLLLLLLLFCLRFWQLRNLLRTSLTPPQWLAESFESVRAEVKAGQSELRLVANLRSPAAMGWRSPKVLFPEVLLDRLTESQIADILRHELMHIRRKDFLWDRLSTLACYIVFFHPAVWSARRRMRWERELVCDEGVAGLSEDHRLEYADCLTRLARWWFFEEPAGLSVKLLSSSESLLSARVRVLLAGGRAPYSGWKKAVAGLSSAAVVITGTWFSPGVAVGLRLPGERLSQAQHLFSGKPSAGIRRRKPAHFKGSAPVPASVTPSDLLNSEIQAPAPEISEPNVQPRRTTAEIAAIVSGPVTRFELESPREDFQIPNSAAGPSPAADVPSPRADDVSDGRSGGGGSVWDESAPQPPQSAQSKIGSIVGRAISLGIGALGHIGDHDRDRD